MSRWSFGVVIVLLHVLGIGCLLVSVHGHSTIVGLGLLAYTFGLRHAFDADHIAAIDNTVRKLRQESTRSEGVGFYFSLGHSTVVCVLAVATALSVQWVQRSIPQLQHIGGVVGTMVSAVFLLLIGVVNLIVFINLYKMFVGVRSYSFTESEFEELLHSRGLIFRLIRPLLKIVRQSWHIYPIGFLFGLGFDTASEVALLAISAGAAKNQLPVLGILALPLLFAAGMCLMDTIDGIFMTTAYDWAFATPVRKIYYNLTVTGMSVAAALFIGLIEGLQVLSPELNFPSQGLLGWVQNINLASTGYVLVGLFVGTWVFSYSIWKFFKIEKRWSSTNT